MPDFDLNKQFDDGFSFTKVFRNIIVYSISIFVAFYWQQLFNEIITAYVPTGTGLSMKVGIGLVVTVFMVGFAYMLVRRNKNGTTTNTKMPKVRDTLSIKSQVQKIECNGTNCRDCLPDCKGECWCHLGEKK